MAEKEPQRQETIGKIERLYERISSTIALIECLPNPTNTEDQIAAILQIEKEILEEWLKKLQEKTP